MDPPDAGERIAPWPVASAEHDRLLTLLRTGRLTLSGLVPWSSNTTFLGRVSDGERAKHVIYKPARGEQPLWDFPAGSLAKREVAAYIVSRSLSWHLVPPTVLRRGPHGQGSVQLFVAVDPQNHFFVFRSDPACEHSLQALAMFDIAVNNADRKGGHCLSAGDGRVVAIDQGLCFHAQPKLRTVIWDYAGEPLPADLADDLGRLHDELARARSRILTDLAALLSGGEIAALRARIENLLASGRFPDPPEDRRPFPWPLV